MKKNTVMVAKGDLMSEEQRMTSMEIAQVTGKPHNDVLKAIRKMEEAWVKVQGGNFSLLQKIYELPNGGKKSTPFYSLTKTECLYVATKFNDEARARLVLRWETLEREQRQQTTAIRKLPVTDGDVLAEAERIVERQLKGNNRNADGCITTTDIAKAMGMTTKELNVLLTDMGIQTWKRGQYRLTPDYEGRQLAQDRMFVYYSKEGKRKERTYLVWTEKGAEMIRTMITS